mgnify:CR=1 FL=1
MVTITNSKPTKSGTLPNISYEQKNIKVMKKEIVNRIKQLGGNVANVKGVSLQEDLCAITFNTALYQKPEDTPWLSAEDTEPIEGLGDWVDENMELFNSDRETFYKKMKEIKGIKTYHENPLDFTKQTAICSINLEEYDSGSVSDELMERFHIQTRSGAHCAPLVHEHFGTVEQGMVRFSFGHETTIEEINQIIHAVKILAEE